MFTCSIIDLTYLSHPSSQQQKFLTSKCNTSLNGILSLNLPFFITLWPISPLLYPVQTIGPDTTLLLSVNCLYIYPHLQSSCCATINLSIPHHCLSIFLSIYLSFHTFPFSVYLSSKQCLSTYWVSSTKYNKHKKMLKKKQMKTELRNEIRYYIKCQSL